MQIALLLFHFALGSSDWGFAVVGVMIVLYVLMLSTAARLASWLGLRPAAWVFGLLLPGVGLFVLIALLLRSAAYFRSEGINADFFGPEPGAIERSGKT